LTDLDNVSCRLAVLDRSVKGNGLQVFGSLTKSEVATGSSLMGFSGFSATDYPEQPYNADLDFGTGDFCVMGWVKTMGGSWNAILHRSLAGSSGGFLIDITNTDYLLVFLSNTTTLVNKLTGSAVIADNTWHNFAVVRSGGTLYIYDNGMAVGIVADSTDITFTNAVTRAGVMQTGSDANAGSLALLRVGATAPSADQIAWIYNVEKFFFEPNAVTVLPGTSDAILDAKYDEVTGLHHILTSWGWSSWRDGVMIDSTAGSWTKVSANNGLVALG